MIELLLGILIFGYLLIAFRSHNYANNQKQQAAQKVSLSLAVMRLQEESVYENLSEIEIKESSKVKYARESGERPSAVLRRFWNEAIDSNSPES